jgi:hypothetical protein
MAVVNLVNEAIELTKGLSASDKYKLYEICLGQLRKAMSNQKLAEVKTVMKVLEHDRSLNPSTLVLLQKGHTEMSDSVTRGDMTGNAKKNKKKQK